MKFKHVIASFALAAITSLGVIAGLSAHKEAKEVKADSGDTWGFGVVLDVSTIPDEWRSECNNFRFHVWGTNVDETFAMHSVGAADIYAVNVSFTDSQIVSGGQFIFEQNSDDKYSLDASFGYSKDSDFFGYMSWKYNNDASWTDGKWPLKSQSWNRAQISYYDTSLKTQNVDMTYDPVNRRFHYDNLVIDSNNIYQPIELLIGGTWNYTYDAIYNYSATMSGSGAWFEVKDTGTYDIFVNDEFKYEGEPSGGIIEIKKHGLTDSYIYYVTQSGDACTDRLYTFGYNESHGDWNHAPRVTDIEGVEEYFGNSDDFKFNYDNDHQGLSRRVYKIPLTVGYPADDKLIITNDARDVQTGNMDIIGGTAYVWEPSNEYTNINIAKALEFVLAAEELRSAASMSSVCNVSAEDAKDLYDEYLTLTVPQQEIVNRCVVWTWADKEMSSSKDVSYALVVEMFGIRGGVISDGSSYNFSSVDNNSIMIIIITISAVSVASLATLLVLKKKRK